MLIMRSWIRCSHWKIQCESLRCGPLFFPAQGAWGQVRDRPLFCRWINACWQSVWTNSGFQDGSRSLPINLSLVVKERTIFYEQTNLGWPLPGWQNSSDSVCFCTKPLCAKGQGNSGQPISSHRVLISSQCCLASKPSWQYKAVRVALPESSGWQGCPTALFTVIFLHSIQDPAGSWGGEIAAASGGRAWLKLLEGLVPPQAPLTWKLPLPNKMLAWGAVGRKLVGGKFHGCIWVMKQRTFLKKWGPLSKSVCYCPTISPCKVSLEWLTMGSLKVTGIEHLLCGRYCSLCFM